MSILTFLIVLFVLVLVHELGHFIAAKRTGMRVDEFGIGFPPKLFGVKRGETEYTINALPIGGFVKIFGEDGANAPSSPDRARSFVAKSKIKQSIVLIAGVLMNVLFAWLLFSLALGIGVHSAVDEASASEDAQLIVTNVVPSSPAETAGLAPGASIVDMHTGDHRLETFAPTAFSAFIENHAEKTISLTYKRGNEVIETTITPRAGVITGQEERVAVGIGLTLVDIVSRPVHTAVLEGATLTLTSLRDITIGISRLLWDAIRFDADLSHVAGPVGIVGLVGEASAFGLTSLLMFTAFISLNLAVINLLPFPALDGGRLLFVLIEAIKGSPIKPQYVHALNTVGFALLILLMLAVTYNDIVRLV